MNKKRDKYICNGCHSNLTEKDSVVRVYHSTDDDGDEITDCLEGRYDNEGNWDSDGTLAGSNWDTFDGDDSCTVCSEVVG